MKKLLSLLALLLAAVVLTAVLIPVFVEIDDYRTDIETALSDALDTPVTIARLDLEVMPVPRIIAREVTISDHNQLELAWADEIIIAPELFPLLDRKFVIDSIHLRNARANPAIAGLFGAKPSPDPAPEPRLSLTINRFSADHLVITLTDTISIGPMSVDAQLDEFLALKQVDLELEDHAGRARLWPDADAIRFEIELSAWQLPTGPALVFDHLTTNGLWADNTLVIEHYAMQAYQGEASGQITVVFGLDTTLDGDADIQGIDLASFLGVLGKQGVAGTFGGTFRFSGQRPAGLDSELSTTLAGDFLVTDGVIYNTDLKKAGSLTGAKTAAGDETPFDEFKGHISASNGALAFTDLTVRAKGLLARGKLNIDPELRLQGSADIGVDEGIGLLNVPVTISGTTAAPVVRPAREAVIGAAIGTVILPGVGTAVGIKAGQLFKKLGDALSGGNKDTAPGDSPSAPDSEEEF